MTWVKYLNLIISTDGISIDPKKVQTIFEWETPTSVKDVQAFTTAPVLVHYNASLKTWVETDSSNFVTARVLS